MLIFTRWQQQPAYEFVPYTYGACSFQARAGKGTMIKYELLKKDDAEAEYNESGLFFPKDDLSHIDGVFRRILGLGKEVTYN